MHYGRVASSDLERRLRCGPLELDVALQEIRSRPVLKSKTDLERRLIWYLADY